MTHQPESIDPVLLREFSRIDTGIANSDNPAEWRVRLACFETEHGKPAMVELRAALAAKKATPDHREDRP